MVKELEAKIQELKQRPLEEFKRLTKVDLTVQASDSGPTVVRDIEDLNNLISGFEEWRAVNKELFASYEQEFGPLLNEYFKEKPIHFEDMFVDKMLDNVKTMTGGEISGFINRLAKAILYRKIEIHAVRRMIALSANEF